MDWLATALLNVASVLVVMSLLAVLLPPLRSLGAWRAIGLAWLATFGLTLVVALTHLDQWSLSCSWLGLIRTGVSDVTAINPNLGEPCSSANGISPWLVALPPLVGIGILLARLGRHAPTSLAGTQAMAALTAVSVAIIGLGQISEALALLLLAAVLAGVYGWPRLQRPRTG